MNTWERMLDYLYYFATDDIQTINGILVFAAGLEKLAKRLRKECKG
jgi:hypothetical protein